MNPGPNIIIIIEIFRKSNIPKPEDDLDRD
jgi:hypothetical protein